MSNYSRMTYPFEKEKNVKAATYTSIVCALLIIIFFFVKWTLPQITPPVIEEGIEVNLGNSDQGLGDVPPQVPGESAAQQEETNTPPAAARPAPQEENIAGDKNETDEAPVVHKTEKPIVKKTNLPKPVTEIPKNRTPAKDIAAANPTPAPPKAKALYKGAKNGPGGNEADSYNGVRNQGIAGGKGDQGSPNGNPNSDSYKGTSASGNSGVRIRSGLNGRRFTRLPSFEDDFNENAKVAVDIRVDRSGNVISAVVNPRGTTTTNGGIRAIATRKAMQLKLNAGDEDEQTGTILFDFKLRG